MAQPTTIYDLRKSATAAAESAVGKDALAVESIKIEAFGAGQFDRADFQRWSDFYQEQVAMIGQQQKELAPSTAAAQQQAAKA